MDRTRVRFAPPSPTPPGLARRMPPAVFPVIMGLFGLGLAWRRAGLVLDGTSAARLASGLGDLVLGATTLLFVFAASAYAIKTARRPSVLADEVAVLPGRLGLSALAACFYLLAQVLAPIAPAAGFAVLTAGLVLHAGVLALLLAWLRGAGAGGVRPGPAGHLYLSALVIAALAATTLGHAGLARGFLLAALVPATGLWLWGLVGLARGGETPPLRPILALHLAAASVAGLTALALGWTALTLALLVLSALILAGLALGVRWLLAARFTPFWAAMTFPLAATASLWLVSGGGWTVAGLVLLAGASAAISAIALPVLKLWANGQLAVRTNAAAA